MHKIWKYFALDIWAPLWHNLYPSTLFLIKGKNPTDELLHMIYSANAYCNIKDDLWELAKNTEELSATNIVMVKDLIFLFEFAIPMVCG